MIKAPGRSYYKATEIRGIATAIYELPWPGSFALSKTNTIVVNMSKGFGMTAFLDFGD